MHILLMNQFFWPDSAATSQFLTDLARHLHQEGHKVTVICSGTPYAETSAPGQHPGVNIIRVPAARFGRGTLMRGASYATYFGQAVWQGLRATKPDLVLTLTTPPLLSLVGTLLKQLRGCNHFIWEMDLFPDALVSLRTLKPDSGTTKFLQWISDYSRRKSDGVITLGECMRARLLSRGLPASKVQVAENWADCSNFQLRPLPDHGPLHIVYSGNLGLAHDVETIAAVMDKLRDGERFRFTFIGGGANRKVLESFCGSRRISNVFFLGYTPRDEVSENLSLGHIGLVTHHETFAGTVVPSKVYGIMAAGRPLLYIGPKDATPARIVNRFQCGWQIDCGDPESAVELLERLQSDRSAIGLAGERARQAVLANYDLADGVTRICRILGTHPLPKEVPVTA